MWCRKYCSTSACMQKDLPEPLGPSTKRFLELILPVLMGRSEGSMATGNPSRSVKRIRKSDCSSPARDSLNQRHSAASDVVRNRSEEHTSELQSLMPISYAVFCLTKKKQKHL